MIKIKDKSDCCGCFACYAKCPVQAILMQEDSEGFKYPEVNTSKCVECGICEKVCPIINEKVINIQMNQLYYAAKSREEYVRQTSSSGGVFSVISDYILDQNGAVYAVGYNEKNEVVHKLARTKKERDRLKGSKYVQSNLDNCFKKIKNDLDNGIITLFVGTPCQVSGLNNFLGKAYNNLITLDFVCHGTPSPGLWEKYLELISQKGKVYNFQFRNKKFGWRNSSVCYEQNENFIYEPIVYNQFTVIYFSHFMTRPSCHKCHFTSYKRVSDITVSDFWNIKDVSEVVDDNKGISMIMINTLKGKDIFDNIKGKLHYNKCEKQNTEQPQLNYPSRPSVLRSRFVEDYNTKSLEYVLNKYAPHTFGGKVRKKIMKYFYSALGVIKDDE